MSLDPKAHLAGLLRAALASVAPGTSAEIRLERPRDAAHGDFACSVAMQLARALKDNPRQIAERLVHELPASPWLLKAEVAGAGFINLTLAPTAKTRVVQEALTRGDDFGRGAPTGRKLQVEFVSANPTGPLHVGHGRGAAFGASLANVLAANDTGKEPDTVTTTALVGLVTASPWVPKFRTEGLGTTRVGSACQSSLPAQPSDVT